MTAVVVLSQLYGAIPLFAPVRSAFAVDAGSVAWVQTAFGIAYAAGFIAWGPLVDRFGPKRIMLLGLAALVAATIATSFALSFSWLIAGRVMQGAVAASFAPAAFAYLGARPAPERRVLSITVLTSSFLASAVIGQVAAQFIADHLGWEWFFWVSAAALALTVVMIRVVFLPDLPGTGPAGNAARTLGGLFMRPLVLVLLVATVIILAPMVGLYAAVGTTGLADSTTLLLLRASALPALVWAPFGSRWLARFTPQRRLIAAFLTAGVASAAVALVPASVVGVGIAMFFVAAAVAVSAPAMIQTLSGYAPEARGSITALYTCFLFLGASIAPALVAATAASLSATALVGGIASVIAAALVLVTRSRPSQT
ncbi:MAG: MFS transporter [Microbacterium sp.]